jgi:hypothetical protein
MCAAKDGFAGIPRKGFRMLRGCCQLGWLVGLILLGSGCLNNSGQLAPFKPDYPKRALLPSNSGATNESAGQKGSGSEAFRDTSSVRVASAVQTQQDSRPPDLPPPPKPQEASLPPPDTPPPPAPPPAPSVETSSTDGAANIRRLLKQAEGECATLHSYICRMTRRETVNGSPKPEEMMLFKFRKQPFSIHFKWIGNESKGREVVYVKGRYEDKLHVLMSPGGTSMALAPDSFLIRRSSRHPVTEAGVCSIVEKFAAAVAAADKGAHALRYLGTTKRPDFDEGTTLEGVEEDLTSAADPNLPRGGRRQLYFNTANHLPALVVTKDERGQEVEYYRFDRFQARVKLDDDDFNPAKLFGKK